MTRPRGKPKQYEVLKALRGYQSALGGTPSDQALAEMTGIPMSTVRMSLERLENEDGLIKRTKGTRWSPRHVEIIGAANLEYVSQKYVKKALALQKAKQKMKKSLQQKRTEAGKLGKGLDAFTPKVSKRDAGLSERIEAVVANAKAKEAEGDAAGGDDVMLNRSKPYNRRLRVHSVRIG